jgi:hypothetical protein
MQGCPDKRREDTKGVMRIRKSKKKQSGIDGNLNYFYNLK